MLQTVGPRALGLNEVKTAGYGFQVELTWRALQRGLSVVEVPIITDRVAGKSKMSGDIFREALLLVWKLVSGSSKGERYPRSACSHRLALEHRNALTIYSILAAVQAWIGWQIPSFLTRPTISRG